MMLDNALLPLKGGGNAATQEPNPTKEGNLVNLCLYPFCLVTTFNEAQRRRGELNLRRDTMTLHDHLLL